MSILLVLFPALCYPICFQENIRVGLQALGGGKWDKVKAVTQNGAGHSLVTCDDGDIHHVYGKSFDREIKGYVNFFRQDRYRTVAYYYKKQDN